MRFKFRSPLERIPENLREEYKNSVARCIQARVFVFCITIYLLYMTVLGLSFLIDSGNLLGHRFRLALALTAGVGFMLIYNRKMVKCIHTAKMSAFGFICFMLWLLHVGPIDNPASFTYAGYMIMVLFTVILFPWYFRDAVVISVLHLIGWFGYYASRDLAAITIPETAFGTDPLINGTAFISITAILCLLIRYKDNQRDIYNFVLLKDIEAKKTQMESELEFASKIQDSLVPQSLDSPNADVYVTYQPMESIGGDYANFQLVDEDRLVFFIGDVTGHGVPAALMVNRLHTEFDRLADSGNRPGEILRDLNQFILKSFSETTMYLTAFCGMVDFKTNQIHYSSYGHPPQYIFRLQDESVAELESLTSLLGFDIDGGSQVHESSLEYQDGDMIFMFTDGVLEHKNQAGEEFGGKRLQELIQSHRSKKSSEIHSHLLKGLKSFSSESFKDDVFVISIKCKSKQLVTN